MSTKTTSLAPTLQQKATVWYLEDVNISYSFEMLEKLATDMGADIDKGDIFVCDNPNKNKRKVFRKVSGKYIIVYIALNKGNSFFPLNDKGNGKVAINNMLKYLIFS